LNTRSDTDAVNFRARSDSPQWPKLLGTATASSLATLFVVRNFFPAEKKVRHSIRADYTVGDDTFVRTMGNLLGPPLLEGNKITPLENGDQIFPAMLDGIRSARRTITFENFLFREGEISDAFAESLADRARNGVKVHFLQDALGCDAVHGRAIKLMKRAGVAVEIFRFVHFSRINFRTHRKILVIDGTRGFNPLSVTAHRSPLAQIASDHFPLMAEFALSPHGRLE
jgi:cardiolipin synthase A/B